MCIYIRIHSYKIFVERLPESCLICVWIKALFLRFRRSFRWTVLIKQGQRFGVVCLTEMSATHNYFADLICTNIRRHRYQNFVEQWPESCLICICIKALLLGFKTSFRISVLIKQGQRFGVVCETAMSATRNPFAALICINIQTHSYTNFYWTIAGKLSKLRLKQHGLADLFAIVAILDIFVVVFIRGGQKAEFGLRMFFADAQSKMFLCRRRRSRGRCICNKNIFTQARIHQKSAAHFAVVVS